MTKLPITTTVAYLPSAGLNERRATKHLYSHSEIMTTGAGPARCHFFRCSETGELRRWGADALGSEEGN